jgi:hypothetical protein
MTALVVLLNTRNTPLVHAAIALLPLVKRTRRRVEVSPPKKGYAESISGVRRDGYRLDGTFLGLLAILLAEQTACTYFRGLLLPLSASSSSDPRESKNRLHCQPSPMGASS